MVIVGPYNIELVPRTSWGKSLAQLSHVKESGFRKIWDKIRKRDFRGPYTSAKFVEWQVKG